MLHQQNGAEIVVGGRGIGIDAQGLAHLFVGRLEVPLLQRECDEVVVRAVIVRIELDGLAILLLSATLVSVRRQGRSQDVVYLRN